MRTITLAAVLAALAVTSSAAAAAPSSATRLAGRVVDRPTVKAGEVHVPLLVTSAGRSRRATLAVPRAALRRPANLRLGDRVRGRNHRWLRVTARAAGPTFAQLDALVSGARQAAEAAATDLRRFSQLPPDPLTGPAAVTATRDDAERLRERLNLLDTRLADLGPALGGAITAVQAAYAGEAARHRTLRRARDSRVARLRAAVDAAIRTRQAIEQATFVLDERLSKVPPSGVTSGVEIPLGTVSTVSEVAFQLIEALGRLP